MRRSNKMVQFVILLAALSAVIASCSPASTRTPGLRITNSGSTPILDLIVLFPEDRVVFGDIPAGGTTDYQDVPNGVYAYAAYQFEIDGRTITQPVIDWVGEVPLEGQRFTYTIDADTSRPELQIVRLISVTQDD